MSAPNLSAARAAVLVDIGAVDASLRPPSVAAAGPLSPLPAAVEARVAARVAAGLSAVGGDHPRAGLYQRVVLPAGALATVDAVGTGVVGLDGHPLLALVGAGVFAALGLVGMGAARRASADPLRLRPEELRAVTDASRWQSRQVWTGPLASSREYAAVVVAARMAGRIGGTWSWNSGGHRARLDLRAELGQLDDQACRIAVAGAAGSPDAGAAWEALVDRIAALRALADGLDDADDRAASAAAAHVDPRAEAELAAGAARDELAAEQIGQLTAYLREPRGFTLE